MTSILIRGPIALSLAALITNINAEHWASPGDGQHEPVRAISMGSTVSGMPFQVTVNAEQLVQPDKIVGEASTPDLYFGLAARVTKPPLLR